jgi:hypothetical protein
MIPSAVVDPRPVSTAALVRAKLAQLGSRHERAFLRVCHTIRSSIQAAPLISIQYAIYWL